MVCFENSVLLFLSTNGLGMYCVGKVLLGDLSYIRDATPLLGHSCRSEDGRRTNLK